MSNRLYRRGENGVEPFLPATSAERVTYKDGSVRDALDALASVSMVDGIAPDESGNVALPEITSAEIDAILAL